MQTKADAQLVTTLEEFRQGVLCSSEDMLARLGEAPPHFVLLLPQGLVYMPLDASQMNDPIYKAVACRVLRETALRAGATFYAFVAESWMATYSSLEGETPENATPPSQRLDRREVLTVVGGGPLQPFHSMREILRGAEGKVIGLGPENGDYTDVGGRFAGLLDPEPVATQ